LNTKQKAPIEFYQNLGKLFYAIAAVDNSVRDEEFKMLKNVIATEWIALNDFEYSYNNNSIIIDTFKQLHNNPQHEAEFYFNSFLNFKRTHEAFFNKKINSLILKTARKIATSFSDQNKSELILLAKLHLELNKKV
jgi:hypothetical protein